MNVVLFDAPALFFEDQAEGDALSEELRASGKISNDFHYLCYFYFYGSKFINFLNSVNV